jgi:hypothetical protein
MWNIACHDDLRTPLVSKEQLAKMQFTSLSSTLNGDGDIFYVPLQTSGNESNEKIFLVIYKFFEDKVVPMDPDTEFSAPHYRTEVDRVHLLCAEKKLAVVKNEWYDASNNLAYLTAVDPQVGVTSWIEIKQDIVTPLTTLQRIFCNSGEASK